MKTLQAMMILAGSSSLAQRIEFEIKDSNIEANLTSEQRTELNIRRLNSMAQIGLGADQSEITFEPFLT